MLAALEAARQAREAVTGHTCLVYRSKKKHDVTQGVWRTRTFIGQGSHGCRGSNVGCVSHLV